MENIRILIKLIYKNSNVPVIEDLNIENDVTFNKIETTVNEVIKNGFMFMCIKMKKEAKKFIWIIDYLKSKTQRIEIDLSQSSGLDEQMLVSTNNLCYKINSNTQLRFLLENMDYSYEISLPEDIFISNYDEQVLVLALPSNKVTVSSVKSLVGNEVATISNTKIASFLESKGVEFKSYSSISELLSKVKDDSLIVLDSEVYNYYNTKYFNNYKSIYSFDMSIDYSFKVFNDESNVIFIKFLNFYLSFYCIYLFSCYRSNWYTYISK